MCKRETIKIKGEKIESQKSIGKRRGKGGGNVKSVHSV